jgi:ketosteroid isomerase-like protein
MKTLFLLLLLPVLSKAQTPDERAVRKASAQFSSNYVRGDFQGMTEQYTEDAVVMAPARDVLVGRAAILEFWKGTTVPVLHESVPEKIEIDGGIAHDYGYFFTQSQKPGEAPGPVNSAKYYIRWQKGTDGVWRMALDMWNSRKPGWSR